MEIDICSKAYRWLVDGGSRAIRTDVLNRLLDLGGLLLRTRTG